MKSLFTSLLIASSTIAWSQQFSSEVFHEGFLITSEKDTIQGKLKYNTEDNVVSMVCNGKIKTFSSHKIFYFEINDEILNTYRQFYSIPYKVSYGYKIPILFELLYEGPLSLLTREVIIQQSQTSSSVYWRGANYSKSVVRYSFFFLTTEGGITYFSGRKKDLLAVMFKKQVEVKQYIKNNRLDTSDVRDLIRIVAFFNSI